MEAHGRVLAVAKVHRSLYTSQNVQSVSLHRYIEALAEDIESAAGDEARAIRSRSKRMRSKSNRIAPSRSA